MRRVTPFWILLTTLLVACQAPEQEDALRLDRGDYNRAFQACIEAGREQDMSPALADRSNGIIETEPRLIGSLLEPWRTDTKGIDQTLQATLQMERRRVRFVFVPEGFEPQTIDGASDFRAPRRRDRRRIWHASIWRPSKARSNCARACSSSADSRPESDRAPGAARCGP